MRSIAEDKITRYLLEETHPKGGTKARFFGRFGFGWHAPHLLLEALRRHPDMNAVVSVTKTAFGTKSVVQCSMMSPDGRNPCIRSVWLRDIGSDVQRFVTAYPTPLE